jgi:hypothetical protein
LTLLEFGKDGIQIHITSSNNGNGIENKEVFVKSSLRNAENRMVAIKRTYTFES